MVATREQYEATVALVRKYNFGQRGQGDGDKRMQAVGIMGQVMFADWIGHPRPSGEDGFDGGFDFVINGKKVDLKTMSRSVDMKPHYVHNFVGYQLKYDCEYYVFASYNLKTNVLSICGVVSKQDFLKKSVFYNQGDKRYRDDGTYFLARTPLYEIKQSDLISVDSREELVRHIA